MGCVVSPVRWEAGMGNFDSRFDSKLIDRWRVLLDDGVQPAVLARVCRWGRAHSDDLATEILRLAHAGVIRVHRGERYDRLRGCDIEDYRLSRDPSAAACADPVDAITLKMLFDVIADGADELWMGEFYRYGRSDAGEMRKAMTSWQAALAEEVERMGAFTPASVFMRQALPVAAGVCLVGGLLATLGTGSPLYLVGLAVLAIALVFVWRQMPKLSPEAARQYEAAKQLRAWLRDLPARGKGARFPDDQEFWGKLMPLAFMLGESESALKALGAAAPEVLDEAFDVADGGGWLARGMREVAWPAWYQGPSVNSRREESTLPSLSAMLPAYISSTAFAANATVSNQMLASLYTPIGVVSTIGGIPGVGGLSNAPASSAELFERHPKKPSEALADDAAKLRTSDGTSAVVHWVLRIGTDIMKIWERNY